MSRKQTAIVLTAVAVLFLFCIYFCLDPAKTPFPRCPFNLLTGLKCPGCGSQRALHQLLRLNLSGAFHYNAMLVICIPIVLFYGSAELFGERFPRLQSLSRSGILSWSVFTLFLAWWILRNIFNW